MSEENALMRSVRLQRPADAVYWISRLRNEEHGNQRLARRLFQCALRDNLRVDLMLQAEGTFLESGNPATKLDLSRLAMQLASSEKLWSCDIGRKLVSIINSVQSNFTFRQFTDAELYLRLDSLIVDSTRFLDAVSVSKEMWNRYKGGKNLNGFLEIMRERCKGTEAVPAVELLARCLARTTAPSIAEETLFYLVLAWASHGIWGQRVNAVREEEIYGQVATRLQDWEPVPAWASAGDRRFEATWDGYENMCSMFDANLRLSPEDQGALFCSRNGQWFPVIKEESGLYQVQSQSNPHQYYEVNLAILSCTCQEFIRRKRRCKHIAAARLFIGDKLPFTVEDLDESRCAS
jgi:hypothetical protein